MRSSSRAATCSVSRPAAMRHIRGGQIGMIPQNPLSSLNPVITIESHFQEVLSLHLGLNKHQARERAIELLRSVGIPDPATRMQEYPHRLSGGQRQRVIIALAMACQPRLLIADEPTTALDVTIQAQILELIDDLVDRSNLGAILITHNLGIVAGHCDRVVVMYAGRVMETATVLDLFDHPSHPYTVGPAPLRAAARCDEDAGLRGHPGAPPPGDKTHARDAPSLRAASAPPTSAARKRRRSRRSRPRHWIACWNPVETGEKIAS